MPDYCPFCGSSLMGCDDEFGLPNCECVTCGARWNPDLVPADDDDDDDGSLEGFSYSIIYDDTDLIG